MKAGRKVYAPKNVLAMLSFSVSTIVDGLPFVLGDFFRNLTHLFAYLG